jgi:hypothetical protein
LQDSGGARAEADCVASGLEPKLTVLQATWQRSLSRHGHCGESRTHSLACQVILGKGASRKYVADLQCGCALVWGSCLIFQLLMQLRGTKKSTGCDKQGQVYDCFSLPNLRQTIDNHHSKRKRNYWNAQINQPCI